MLAAPTRKRKGRGMDPRERRMLIREVDGDYDCRVLHLNPDGSLNPQEESLYLSQYDGAGTNEAIADLAEEGWRLVGLVDAEPGTLKLVFARQQAGPLGRLYPHTTHEMTIGVVLVAVGLWAMLAFEACRPEVALGLALGVLAGVLLRDAWG